MRAQPLRESVVRELAQEIGRAEGVSPALLLAIASHESAGFRPDAYRAELHVKDGSHGLMQLLFQTAKAVGYSGSVGEWNDAARMGTGLYDPRTNLTLGARHLRGLLMKVADPEMAISAYNAGLGNAKRATSAYQFCVRWKESAPAVGRTIARDCAEVRTVRVGEFPNQPYVDRVLSLWRRFGRISQDRGLWVAAMEGGAGPGGASASSPSSSPSTQPVFVVKTVPALLMAAALALWGLFKRKERAKLRGSHDE